MGFAKPKSSTIYYREYDWKRSPEVWGAFAKAFGLGVLAGVLLLAILLGKYSDKLDAAKANVPCKAPASSAPAQTK